MKKIIPFVLTLGLACFALKCPALNAKAAVNTFTQDLEHIRNKLKGGKMNAMQANVLLKAIAVRQNNVIIMQNDELLEQLKRGQYESK